MPDTSDPPKTQKPLPPGMVIGPDGKPCRICTAFRNWKPETSRTMSTTAGEKNKAGNASFAAMTGVMNALATGSTSATLSRPDEPPAGCPPDVEQLGRATWTFLHTTAAYWPDRPSQLQRRRMIGLLFSLPVLYPCSHCATHLGDYMKLRPPDVSGRDGLSRWLCEVHNEVNERLGKPTFSCSIKNLDERWKDGPSDGRCD